MNRLHITPEPSSDAGNFSEWYEGGKIEAVIVTAGPLIGRYVLSPERMAWIPDGYRLQLLPEAIQFVAEVGYIPIW